jgi:hypothetical protein
MKIWEDRTERATQHPFRTIIKVINNVEIQ